MKIKIEMDMPRWLSRVILVGIPVAIVAIGAWVYADVPNTFKAGQIVSAQKMMENFNELQRAISAQAVPTATANGLVISAGATVYKAATAPTTGHVGVGGWRAAKAMCATAVGTPTAHVCMPDELVRSAQIGAAPAGQGWYAAGYTTVVTSPGDAVVDCKGFTDASPGIRAPCWHGGGLAYGDVCPCDSSMPLLCCD